MLQKIRTLAVQSVNGTNSAEDRKALQQEVNSLSSEVTRIAKQTKFGGYTVLNGKLVTNTNPNSLINSVGKVTFQVGANNGDEIVFNLGEQAFTLTGIADMANVQGKDTAADAAGQGGTGLVKSKQNGAEATWTISTAEGAKATLANIDKIIAQVDSKRADLGALQNRLESSIRNQANVAANQADARSRIRDADFAEESAALSQQSIIQQAAASMLMQANSRPQLALSMLG